MSLVRRWPLGVIALVGFASAPAWSEYGRTAGQFDVSNGSATYDIPIWTPAGPNGMTPGIPLNYSSTRGNGIGGVGWSLSAVSSIERCPRTKHQDGGGAPIELTLNDRFCIGGNRLRAQPGAAYGAPNSVYFTEMADYSRITAFNSEGNGPRYFVVEAKNGLKYEYGATANSRVMLGATVLRWMLNKVYDRSGNNYVVSYLNTTGFAAPDVVSWTPTFLGSTSYRYEAKFNYLTTRTDEDSYLAKVANFDVANRYRLENIQIKSAGSVARKYRFTYDTSTVTSRSRLRTAKECVDDAETNCLLPLSFDYQAGQSGVSSSPTSGLGSATSLKTGKYDFNGDGKSDLLYVTGSTWKVSFSTGTGFTAAVDTAVSSSATFLVQRFLANHQDGLLVSISNVWTYVGYNGSSFVTTSTGVPVPTGTVSGGETKVTDHNGDGTADLVWTVSGDLWLRLNVTAAGATSPSFASPVAAWGHSVGQGNIAIIDAQKCPVERTCDVNGDGRADLIVNVVSVTGCGMGGCTTVNYQYDLFAAGTGAYTSVTQTGAIGYTGLHFNDDRCIDRIPNAATNTLQIAGCNTGAPASTITMPGSPVLTLDWNGDGSSDLLVGNGGFFGVYLSKGNPASPFSSLVSTTVPTSSSCLYFAFDPDGDGLDDVGCVGTSSPYSVSYFTHNGSGGTYLTQQPDLLNSIVDGFGVSTVPSYVSTSQNNYTRVAGTQLPLVDSTDPLIVVAQVTSSNGIGGTYTKTFNYHGAREHRERGEFAGFYRIDEVDSRNGIIGRSYFEQLFPRTGMLSQQETMQPNGVTAISRTVLTNTFATLDADPGEQRYFTYAQTSTATQYESGSAWNGNLLRTVTTNWVYDTASGFAYDVSRSTVEPASGANGVTGGGVWIEGVLTPLAQILNDTGNWCIGRPRQVQHTKSHNLTYGASITRTTDTAWNAAMCRPTQITDELGSSTMEVVTGIGYDGFGNVSSTTVTGTGMAARSMTFEYSDLTNTTGQFPLVVRNAFNQPTTTAWNYDLGVPTSSTDPNLLTTSWQYDLLGRRTRETRPDGAATTWTYNNCSAVSGGCVGAQNRVVVIETALNTTGGFVNDVWSYLDAFERPIVGKTRILSGVYNRVDREYDALGRVYRDNAPCLWTSCTNYWTTNIYDLLDRVTATSRPTSDSNPTLATTSIFYEGLTTRIQDPLLKISQRISNAATELVRSQDHNGYYQAFEYDAFGNPKRVMDQLGNTLQSSSYNLRGGLTGRTDMDMGAWSFTPNALGETVSQTDAKGQTTTFVIDELGRLASRTEAEGTSVWTWGTSSANKNIGRIAAITGPGYSESITYNSHARPVARVVTIGGTAFTTNYAYSTIGTGDLDNMTYPSSSGYRLKLKFDYQNGQLYRIRDFNALTTVFWQANASNNRNQLTQETLANGLVSNRVFDAVTAHLKTIQTGVGGGTGVQNLAYEWDAAGNLSWRRDVNQSNLTESFFYDDLHRLDYANLNGVQNLDMSYDVLGNVMSKTGVGTYTYHPTKKHQVTSTANGWSFGYDNNGNMTSGRGATIGWTSYNYPSSIVNGSNSSTFEYTPDRQYFRQVSNYTSGGTATTLYAGGNFERVSTSTGTAFRHYIRAGNSTIVYTRTNTSGTITTDVSYVTRDHLGSNSAVTNSSGGILVNFSFDAFGKRRGSNWSGSPSAGDWSAIASTTRRGYTDHSMLDNLTLIHMNGRVQDPELGRFLSADRLISEPWNTQNFNRYSYVYNNPLRFTDPTGFETEDEEEEDGDERQPSCRGSGSSCADSMRDSADRVARDAMEQIIVNGYLCDAECMRIVGQIIAQWNAYLASLIGQGSSAVPTQIPLGGAGSGVAESDEKSIEELVDKLSKWACKAGNAAQFIAENGAKASMIVELSGAAVGGVGLLSGNPTAAVVGGSMMGAGGWGSVGASGVQLLGGTAQLIGRQRDVGWNNIKHGGINVAASLSTYSIFRAMALGGRSVSQRLFNSYVDGAGAVSGLTIDTITYISPEYAPQMASCGTR
jgi:RHS repeat-associated protein